MNFLLTIFIIACTFGTTVHASPKMKTIRNCESIEYAGETFVGSESATKITENIKIYCSHSESTNYGHCQQDQQYDHGRSKRYYLNGSPRLLEDKIIQKEFLIPDGGTVEVDDVVYSCGGLN